MEGLGDTATMALDWFEERDEIAVRVRHRELSISPWLVIQLAIGVNDTHGLEERIQLTYTFNLNPATGSTRDERLGA